MNWKSIELGKIGIFSYSSEIIWYNSTKYLTNKTLNLHNIFRINIEMDNSVIDILKFQNYVNIFERVVLSWIFQFFELNRILFVYRITRKQWIERKSMRNIFIFQNRYSL